MSESIETNVFRDPTDNAKIFTAKFYDSILQSDAFRDAIYMKIANAIAERYVEENYAEIAAALNPQAIANLSIADAAKKIAEEIQRRPTVQDVNVKAQINKHFSLF